MYVCMYVCMYRIYIYTHTYMSTYTNIYTYKHIVIAGSLSEPARAVWYSVTTRVGNDADIVIVAVGEVNQ